MSNWKDLQPSFHGLNRELLPAPYDFYNRHLSRLHQPNSHGWAKGICPFHNDTNPSLSVNLRTGCFKCFACGESGGDIISFYMRINNIDFVAACKQLGAWGLYE